MLKAFKKHLYSHFPKVFGKRIIVALSGGADSMVLCHLLYQLKTDIVIAHCNFHLRGEESDADTDFVQNWAKKQEIKCFIRHFDTLKYSQENRLNTQLSARKLRYNWFEELRKTENADFIATAHHADDNLETFLINLSRGTGIKGLMGIPPQNGNIIRPLLPFSKEQILEYAQQEKLSWREDSSNTSDKYLRNRIRHHISDDLKLLHPTFLDNFYRTLQQLQQTQSFTQNQIEIIRNQLFQIENNTITIEIDKLKKLTPLPYLLYELFSPYGFSNVRDLEQILTSISGKELISDTHRLIKYHDKWLITKVQKENNSQTFLLKKGVSYIETPIKIKVEKVEEIGNFNKNHIYVDADTLIFPLKFRHWQKSDYFRPFGMKGVKKLSKFFKDEKYSTLEKENQWLLCSENEIVWVIGKRADEQFKVTDKTNNILKITYITN